MMENTYEGMVGMKPEVEKRHFYSGDDDFTYQVPQVYFECLGKIEYSQRGFDWRDDSVIVVKDKRAVRYTEVSSYELLMTTLDGQTEWVDGITADIMGCDIENIMDIRPTKSYWIEEFDWNNSVKRKYRVILEETSKLEEYDEGYLKSVIDRDSKCIGEEYVLENIAN